MSHRLIEDFGLTAGELAEKYDEAEQHPVVRLADWRRAVRDHQTMLGYWNFVHTEIMLYQAELDECNPYNQLMGEIWTQGLQASPAKCGLTTFA